MRKVLLLTTLVVAVLSADPFHTDSFEMRRWVTLPLYGWYDFPAGDADHNGKIELYLSAPDTRGQMCIAEYVGDTLFDTTLVEHDDLRPWLICDPDRDGKMNLIAQALAETLQLYEASDSFSFPDGIVWEQFFYGNGFKMYPSITDLDRDSVLELTMTHHAADSLRIYEVVGDDSLVLKARLGIGWPHMMSQVVETHDLDRDGWPELLASGGESGLVVFYEAVGNDSFVYVAQCSLHNEEGQILTVAAAPDMDRDGRPEAIAYGIDPLNVSVLAVLESPSNDSFAPVWIDHPHGSYFGEWMLKVGDVDGDSIPEFALATNTQVLVYRCTGNDQYEVLWSTWVNSNKVGLVDIDGDGRCEVLVDDPGTTVIYKYMTVGQAEQPPTEVEPLSFPTVMRASDLARCEGRILDVQGRDVTEQKGALNPGVYFCRLTAGSASSVRKLLIVP